MTDDKKLPVIELFGPTIQGEGLLSGTLSHFLRLGGCGYRCKWCDSMFAVDPEQVKENATYMTTAGILDEVRKLPKAPYITFSGGDPCIHESLGDIIPALQISGGYYVAVETQGQFYPDWLLKCDVVTFSPKGPSSGNETPIEPLAEWLLKARRSIEPHELFKGKVCIKVVVQNMEDLEYALRVYRALTPRNGQGFYDSFYFNACTNVNAPTDKPEQRVSSVLEGFGTLADVLLIEAKNGSVDFNEKVHVGCQQHVLLWPSQDTGV